MNEVGGSSPSIDSTSPLHVFTNMDMKYGNAPPMSPSASSAFRLEMNNVDDYIQLVMGSIESHDSRLLDLETENKKLKHYLHVK
jgi:hypothetical protein